MTELIVVRLIILVTFLCNVAGSTKPKLRALCLHGYLSNARMFSTQLSKLVEASSSTTDFVFLDAPHALTLGTTNTASKKPKARKLRWFYATQEPEEIGGNLRYEGIVESLKLISEIQKTQGPFDVLVGHSQGSLLLLLINLLTLRSDFLVQFLGGNAGKQMQYQDEVFSLPQADALNILMSGFLPRDDVFRLLQNSLLQEGDMFGLLTQPSLHVFAVEDQVVPMAGI